MSEKIIPVSEARRILNSQHFERTITRLALVDAIGLVLAEDIFAPLDLPPFHQSSMDGYAFSFGSLDAGSTLRIVGEIPAGSSTQIKITKGEAVRIFTGSALPGGADTVVMQERTSAVDGQVTVVQDGLKEGDNRRLPGSDIKKGELAVTRNTTITAATIGFLGALGINEVAVYSIPSVSLVITGNELQQAGEPLKYGQVYEASSSMLIAALSEMGLKKVTTYFTRDDLEETTSTINTALLASNVVLITGGVSVGDYDFVVKATKHCGVQLLFHKVRQRPGKPLYAGRKEEQPVFGLPGNPSSVLTCFYQYVWPLLRKLTGHSETMNVLKVPLAHSHEKNNQLTHFLKGFYDGTKVMILSAQESYRLSSFATANCLVVLQEDMRTYEVNEMVEINLLPVYG